MQITNDIRTLIHAVAKLAESIKHKSGYYLCIGFISASYIGWQWIDFQQALAWTIIKASLLLAPLLIWFLFYSVATQLSELPEALETFEDAGQESITLIKNLSNSENKTTGGISKVFQLFKMLRTPEIFEFVTDSVKGVAIIMNPLLFFALIASSICIFFFAIIALLLLIF